MIQKLLGTQVVVLLAGTIFAWYTVYIDFAKHTEFGYSWLDFKDCVVPNPLITACFYGAIAFLIALISAIYIFYLKIDTLKKLWQLRLAWLLGAGTIFALSNFGYTLYKYYILDSHIGCSGEMIVNPFFSVCFIGFCFFAISFILALVILRKNK